MSKNRTADRLEVGDVIVVHATIAMIGVRFEDGAKFFEFDLVPIIASSSQVFEIPQ